MRELRVVVAGHRVSDLDSELAGARSLLRSAGVSARVIGDGAGLPGTAQAALGWVVREAITNIIRHSDAATAKIELDIAQGVGSERTAMLRIENDGARAPAPGSDGGAGLVGLRERLAGLGGALNTEALPGGRFLLQVRLPLDRQSSAATSPEPVP
jgi:two-component system sensor histidine kinase DesK